MSDDEFSEQWHRIRGRIQSEFGRLTDADVERVRGQRENLIARLRERYGDTTDQAARRLNRFMRRRGSADASAYRTDDSRTH